MFSNLRCWTGLAASFLPTYALTAVIGISMLSLDCESALAAPVVRQMNTASTKPNCIRKCSFEVTLVKLSKPATLTSIRPTLDGYSAKGITARALICSAYNLKTCDLVEGLPRWADSTRFDIEAKMDEDTAIAFRKLPENEEFTQLRFMLQHLMKDRFKLKVHDGAKNIPVYSLIPAKSGVRLKEATASEAENMVVGPSGIMATATTIEDLIGSLPDMVGRVVIDGTGLKGKYDFTLKTTTDERQGSADPEPSIFTALQEQLGLKLVSTNASVDTVVIDSIEKPDEN